jgi:hypothetical protein
MVSGRAANDYITLYVTTGLGDSGIWEPMLMSLLLFVL